MKPIQILVDDELLTEVDRVARAERIDRSKLIRKAVVKYLGDAHRKALEERHRAGYRRKPQRKGEIARWEGLQQWPEE